MIDCVAPEECRYALQKTKEAHNENDGTTKQRIDFAEESICGVDVNKENWNITIHTGGEEVFNGRIPGSYNSLKKVLDKYRGNSIKVAYEAGPFGFWLYDRLTEDGIEALVVRPSTIPVESGKKVKTDKRDTRKLAILLERDMLKRTYVLFEEEREHRDLLQNKINYDDKPVLV